MHVETATRRNEPDEPGCSDGLSSSELLGSTTRRANYDPDASGSDLRGVRPRQSGSVSASLWAACSRPGLPAFVEKAMQANQGFPTLDFV